MISSEKNEKETFYSPYGYIQVDKADYESSSQLIKFTKSGNVTGTVNVFIYIISIEKRTIKEDQSQFKNILWA